MGFKRRLALWLSVFGIISLAASGLHAAPDPADLKDLDGGVFAAFAAKASNTVEVNLEGTLLKMGAGFISADGDEDAAKIKKLLAGLKSVTVRSFEFKTKGQYNKTDVDAIRKQLKSPEWSSIVNINDKETGEATEVYVLANKDKPGGLLIICAEPTELTFVEILGAVDISDLSAFNLGLPGIDVNSKGKKDGK